MTNTPLQSLIQLGTKLWLDSVDPDLISQSRKQGATGATSNPVIISDLIKSGRYDRNITELIEAGQSDDDIAWQLADDLVRRAQDVYLPVWENSNGNNGYVSFELDPLLEDPELGPTHQRRVQRYVELGTKWSSGHKNRMIKVPATPAGIEALTPLVATGVTVNVTLIFTIEQYLQARDAVWAGARQLANKRSFKSVYSIFISRIDVYTDKYLPTLSEEAQGQVGILNVKRIWKENQSFWRLLDLPLQQEIVFASTGTKKPDDPTWKYVQALAGSDIQTNPPATNDKVDESDIEITRTVDQLPSPEIVTEIDAKVDFGEMQRVLMEEGVRKFVEPQKDLLDLISRKRVEITSRV